MTRQGRLVFRFVTAAMICVLALGYGREIAIRLFEVPPAAIGGRLFSLDSERNVPAWFTVLLLLGVAVAMARAAFVEFAQRRGTAWGWSVLALGFVYLAADEQLGLHERLEQFADSVPDFGGIFHFRWVAAVLPVVLVVGIGFIPFLLRLPRPTAVRLVVAGAVYVGGALGMEMVGGIARAAGEPGIAYVLSATIEETLEMLGGLLALRTLLLHLGWLGSAPVPRQPAVVDPVT